MKKELCTPCAMELSEKRSVQFVSRGTNQKVTCNCCGRRRFGGVYDVRWKRKSAPSVGADKGTKENNFIKKLTQKRSDVK